MKWILAVTGIVLWSLSAVTGPAYAAEPEKYESKLLSFHGSIGLAYYEQWTTQSSPALPEMKPELVGSLYMGSKFVPKAVSLGGTIQGDIRRGSNERRGSVALLYSF